MKRIFTNYDIAPVILLTVLILIDYYFFPGVTITPIFTLIFLGLMAMISPLGPMVFWAFVFSTTTIYIIYHPEIFIPGAYNRQLGHVIHSASTLVGAALSVLLCHNRLKAQKKTEYIELLAMKTPTPLILSDKNGEIVFVNDQAALQLGFPNHKLVGNSIFSFFPSKDRGSMVSHYLELLESKASEAWTIEIKRKTPAGMPLQATLNQTQCSTGKYMISTITENPQPMS